jgi:hypothetical protein
VLCVLADFARLPTHASEKFAEGTIVIRFLWVGSGATERLALEPYEANYGIAKGDQEVSLIGESLLQIVERLGKLFSGYCFRVANNSKDAVTIRWDSGCTPIELQGIEGERIVWAG